MTDRCEPPPELWDRDGWHWVEAPAIKQRFVRRWWRARGEWFWADMDERTLRSFRYLSPVATPAEVEALRAELMRAGAECADAMAQVATLRARVVELERIVRLLAGFAETAATLDWDEDNNVTWAAVVAAEARAALSPKTP